MAAHQLLLLCVVMVADISMSVAEPVPSMGSSTRMEVFWSSFSPGLAPAPAPAPVPAPAPARGWADSGGAESEQIRRLGRHQGDRSTAGGDVILGAFATAMFASVFCYIRITRNRAS
ncbi:hypothetical protein Nepgr_007208 [Nepenthes gracilis]|uniref:Uncharacterized protein n=1 Tax=Nepenthes gracilis TaxID=150966 RepID=A0AAD3XI30_NEPGR|nr:hypothetical protein Nepgr_007208 [Nepenthes gracilis]